MSAVAQVLTHWREALAWRPDPDQVVATAKRAVGAYRHGWPGFLPDAFPLHPAPTPQFAPALLAAYDDAERFNAEHFAGLVPPMKICINGRLRSTGGQMNAPRRLLELNGYRVLDLPETIGEVVFHEMIHLWLYTRGLPSGHTPTFRAKMAERGHLSIRFGVPGDPKGMRHAYPGSDRRVVYRCRHCGREYVRRAKFVRPMLCGACVNAGRGRHKLVLDRYLTGEEQR